MVYEEGRRRKIDVAAFEVVLSDEEMVAIG